MAWIESHQSLEKHPKVFDLMHTMKWDLDTTLGKLHRLWWWCVDYAEDGDLRRHDKTRIGAAVGLNGDSTRVFVSSLIKHGWIDQKPYLRIHDWWQYIGPYLQSRYKRTPEKWERVRNLYVTVTSPEREPLRNRIPLPTNQPLPNQPTKKIKDDAAKTRRVFMQHLTQKLKKQCGDEAVLVVKTIYGLVIAWLAKNPKDQPGLSEEIDKLPMNMPRDWYVQAIRSMVERRKHEWIKNQEALGNQSAILQAIAEGVVKR